MILTISIGALFNSLDKTAMLKDPKFPYNIPIPAKNRTEDNKLKMKNFNVPSICKWLYRKTINEKDAKNITSRKMYKLKISPARRTPEHPIKSKKING